MRRLIVTADDFGLATQVNEAVEYAHLHGILNTASLMVAAPGAADAIDRARRLPKLRVGLHLVLVNGRPALEPSRVPALVDGRGDFDRNLFNAGVRYFFHPQARRQLRAEIAEQFRRFAETGLVLDHLNAQNHMHVHPTILSIALDVGRQFGLRAVRVPREPFVPSWRAGRTRFAARVANSYLLAPWIELMRARLRRAGIAFNDYIFGMIDTGHMDAGLLHTLLSHLPEGVSEIYSHPATAAFAGADSANADYRGELEALVDPKVIATLRSSNIQPVAFSELSVA
ncbi:MAG TPA: hopanoid biosynthesis-associated protein HpnK [Candidatus Rubrimentiphilum sp.]|nr:hopanoid biosynthesis-associated protein HpnK [Candidatus Rubrimentiphilum sp.]